MYKNNSGFIDKNERKERHQNKTINPKSYCVKSATILILDRCAQCK